MLEISQRIADECNTNYNCKDNVTLILVDLRKHFASLHKFRKGIS